MEEDDFYKPKTLKLNKTEQTFKPTEDTPPEAVVQHFKPIKRESPYSFRNILGILIPLAVTVALGYGGYRGVGFFRDLSARADEADRQAQTASNVYAKMKQDISDYESKARDLDQSIPLLTDRIRIESRS